LAEATGCAVGTAKSRVFRARRQLESWLLGDSADAVNGVRPAPSLLARRMLEHGGPDLNADGLLL
jgi:RNA polymerase sigma-70 factor (ECF subfamily)